MKFLSSFLAVIFIFSCKKENQSVQHLLMKYQWYEYEEITTTYTENKDSILFITDQINNACGQKSFYTFKNNNIVTRDISCFATTAHADGSWDLISDTLLRVSIPYNTFNYGFY